MQNYLEFLPPWQSGVDHRGTWGTWGSTAIPQWGQDQGPGQGRSRGELDNKLYPSKIISSETSPKVNQLGGEVSL